MNEGFGVGVISWRKLEIFKILVFWDDEIGYVKL